MSNTNSSPVREVPVELGDRRYVVRIGAGLLDGLGAAVRALCPAPTATIVTDTNVGPLYAERAVRSMKSAGYDPQSVTIPAGDASNSLEQAARIYDVLGASRMERKSPLVALGGGVMGDLTGFVAATWLRGVPFIQCPTTTEADIDASVGGKTAVNHTSGKNMIGAFYQPRLVLMDIATLQTLDDRDFRAGLAESIKHGAIRDAAMLDWHEQNAARILSHDPAILAELLEKNVRIKAGVVAADEREAGLRAILNFGHTIGHAVESLLHYEWRHGECVAAGMVAVARIAVRRSIMSQADADRLEKIIAAFGLPTRIPKHLAADEIIALTKTDKKVSAGKVHFVFVPRFGETMMRDDITEDDVRAVLAEIRAGS